MALWNRLQGAVFGLGIGAAARDAVAPILETARQSATGQRAIYVLNAMQAAQARAQQIDHGIDYADDAKRSGIGKNRFEVMTDLARNWPGYQPLFELVRRIPTLADEAKVALHRQGYTDAWVTELMKLVDVLPSVTDMVRFGVREVYNPEQRAFLDLDKEFPAGFGTDAKKIGLSDETAKNYWAAHWELPSYTEASQMLFRGEIDPDGFDALLKALDYAPTWRSKLRNIARAIPTMQDFIRFAVREVYTPDIRRDFELDQGYPDVFTKKAALHGMSEADAKDYWAAHWQLPSTEQGFRMFHRGEILLPRLQQLLKAKDVMPFWRDKLVNIAYITPGRIDLRRMLAAGVIDEARVLRGYKDLGYNPTDAQILTEFAVKLAQKSPDQKADPYVDKAQTQLWSSLHSSFVNFDSPDDVAREGLGLLGVSAEAQELVMFFWSAERDLRDRRLTPAQVKTAYRKVVTNPATGQPWTEDEAIVRLIHYGFSPDDAKTFLSLPSK